MNEHRDNLGRLVREAWIKWSLTQDNPKPSWLVPYDELAECDKEADRQIGEALFEAGQNAPKVLTDSENTYFFHCSDCGQDACVTGVKGQREAKQLLMESGWDSASWMVYCRDCVEAWQEQEEEVEDEETELERDASEFNMWHGR